MPTARAAVALGSSGKAIMFASSSRVPSSLGRPVASTSPKAVLRSKDMACPGLIIRTTSGLQLIAPTPVCRSGVLSLYGAVGSSPPSASCECRITPGVVAEGRHQGRRQLLGIAPYVELAGDPRADVVEQRQAVPGPLGPGRGLHPLGHVDHGRADPQHPPRPVRQAVVRQRPVPVADRRRRDQVDHRPPGDQHVPLQRDQRTGRGDVQHLGGGMADVLGGGDAVHPCQGLVDADVAQLAVEDRHAQRRGVEQGVQRREVVLQRAQPAGLHHGGQYERPTVPVHQQRGARLDLHGVAVAVPQRQDAVPAAAAQQLPEDLLGLPLRRPRPRARRQLARREQAPDPPPHDVLPRPPQHFLRQGAPQQHPPRGVEHHDRDPERVHQRAGPGPPDPLPHDAVRRAVGRGVPAGAHASHPRPGRAGSTGRQQEFIPYYPIFTDTPAIRSARRPYSSPPPGAPIRWARRLCGDPPAGVPIRWARRLCGAPRRGVPSAGRGACAVTLVGGCPQGRGELRSPALRLGGTPSHPPAGGPDRTEQPLSGGDDPRPPSWPSAQFPAPTVGHPSPQRHRPRGRASGGGGRPPSGPRGGPGEASRRSRPRRTAASEARRGPGAAAACPPAGGPSRPGAPAHPPATGHCPGTRCSGSTSTPSSSRSSRTSAAGADSPGSSLPPGSSQRPARAAGAVRRAASSRPADRTAPPTTSRTGAAVTPGPSAGRCAR